MKLLIRMKATSATGGNLPNNTIPVEGFKSKFVSKTKIINAGTCNDINKDIKNKSDVIGLTKHFYYNENQFKHQMEGRNQNCQTIGRRLTANC